MLIGATFCCNYEATFTWKHMPHQYNSETHEEHGYICKCVSSPFAFAAACNWCNTMETAAQAAIKMNTLKHIENTSRQQTNSTPSIAVRALRTLTASTHHHNNAHRH